MFGALGVYLLAVVHVRAVTMLSGHESRFLLVIVLPLMYTQLYYRSNLTDQNEKKRTALSAVEQYQHSQRTVNLHKYIVVPRWVGGSKAS